MIKSILVILDESKSSNSAKKLSVQLAKSYKASLTGIGIVDEPSIMSPEAIPLGGVAFKVDLDEKLLKNTRRHVHQLEKDFITYCEHEKIPSSVIDTSGIPTEEIEHFATEFDVLVMGKGAQFNSTSHSNIGGPIKIILQDCPRPVFVTGHDLPNQDSPHIVVAFDGTFASSKALHMAILMGLFKNTNLHIVNISLDEDKTYELVNQAAKLCYYHGLKPHLHPIASAQKPSSAFLRLTEDLHPSSIVMGAYGHSGIRAFFTGSFMQDLLKETNIPLFIFH